MHECVRLSVCLRAVDKTASCLSFLTVVQHILLILADKSWDACVH